MSTMPNRFRRALTAPAKDRPVLDVAATTAEAVADILMRDELLAAVPVFSVAFKAMKALDSTRDRLFAAKLAEFIRSAESMEPTARAALSQKLTLDDDGRRAAETLLLVLERVTDMDKPALLGFLVQRFGAGRIDSSQLRRLAVAVDGAFADDLVAFLGETEEELAKSSDSPHRESLVPSGLTRLLTGETIDFLGSIYWRPTALGELLHAVVREQTGTAPAEGQGAGKERGE